MRTSTVDYVLETAVRHPGRIAVETEAGQVSYACLLRSAWALRGAIRDRMGGRQGGQAVAILMRKSARALGAILAVGMSGNIYCPLDPGAPPQRVRAILDSLGDAVVLVDEAGLALMDGLGLGQRCLLVPALEGSSAAGAVADTAGELAELCRAVRDSLAQVVDTDPCYIIFTSGSTGIPKGVTIPHRGVLDYIDWANSVYDVGPGDKIGAQAPLFFDNSTLDIYLAWSNGACLHLIPEKTFAFAKTLVDHVAAHGITTIFWVPSLLANIANLDLLSSVALPQLRRVLFAGEVMPARVLKYWMAQHPAAQYANLYGPTEITVDCTYFNVPPGWDGDTVPIGVPCRNTSVLVLGPDGQPADEGELLVRGSGVALGYWNDAARTDSAFVQNPLHGRYPERVYRTGDLVRREGGLLYFIGRKDHQIKHNGYRIELGDIETAVDALGLVDGCVAGYDQDRKILYLAAVSDRASTAELRTALARSLPKYMIPSKIALLPALPMTPNGKADRQAVHAGMCG